MNIKRSSGLADKVPAQKTKSPPRDGHLRGHDPRSKPLSEKQDTPYGYCQCGCGEWIGFYKGTNRKLGIVKGEPKRFKAGHGYPPPEERFWQKVDRHGPVDCWPWLGTKDGPGYGWMWADGRGVGAHRFAYELLVGPIPDGLHIDHLCRNKCCVNPAHLEPVTPDENNRRANGYSGTNYRKTHCVNGHEFTPENTYTAPSRPTGRRCIKCERERTRRWRERNAARRAGDDR